MSRSFFVRVCMFTVSNARTLSLASSVGTSMLITVPGIIMSLQTLVAWCFTAGCKHTQGLC